MNLVNVRDNVCNCTTKHVPKPVQLVLSEGVYLCPTTALNLERLVLEWQRHDGEPPGYILKHYSAYVRGLAKERLTDAGA